MFTRLHWHEDVLWKTVLKKLCFYGTENACTRKGDTVSVVIHDYIDIKTSSGKHAVLNKNLLQCVHKQFVSSIIQCHILYKFQFMTNEIQFWSFIKQRNSSQWSKNISISSVWQFVSRLIDQSLYTGGQKHMLVLLLDISVVTANLRTPFSNQNSHFCYDIGGVVCHVHYVQCVSYMQMCPVIAAERGGLLPVVLVISAICCLPFGGSQSSCLCSPYSRRLWRSAADHNGFNSVLSVPCEGMMMAHKSDYGTTSGGLQQPW